MKKKLIRITTVSSSLEGLLKGQLKFLSKYYEVIGVASGREDLEIVEQREGIRTVNIPMERNISIYKDVKSLFALIALFKKERPYIVHSNNPKASLLSMIAAFICKVPCRIYTVTGLRFETATGKFRKILIMMERITCWCATKVIPEGDGVKYTLQRERITNKNLSKIWNGNINGVDIEYFNPSNSDIVKLSKDKNIFTFIFVGRLVRDKGINELVSSFVKLNLKYPDTKLLLLGNFEMDLDPVSLETQNLILNHPSIQNEGFQKDIRPYLLIADTLVFPSYREGFPNVVLQAGAMGLPAIVTDINGCNEIIEENVNGKIIPVHNEDELYKMMEFFIIHRKGIVQSMAAQARNIIVERFEQHTLWKAFLKEYQKLEKDV